LNGEGQEHSMDDRTGATKIIPATTEISAYQGGTALRRRFPTIEYLRRGARRRLPNFAYEYSDGGAGSDRGIARNWAALDAVELVARYGVMPSLPPCEVELFGRRYSAPIGVPPMGGPSLVWPGADISLAEAAQKARVPYVLGMVGGLTIEQAGVLAPDVFWFQLYRMAKNNHAFGFDIVRRAEEAGAQVLVMTMDVPVRTTRPREVVVGLGGGKFTADVRMIADMLRSPRWLRNLARHGRPKFPNLMRYAGEDAGINEVITFARREMGGAFTWDEIARFRDKWKRPMVVKGMLHPADAEKAVSLGIDGIWVSNHGGRQIEALPASIDVLPAIATQVGSRATILFDSGVRSGTDVVRALALGAHASFAGKAFLWGLGALGDDGPRHTIDLLVDETRAALGQIGAHSPAEARSVVIRHPGALSFSEGSAP
jgi:L-lactate dehydrogenase (cytochrome)